MIQNIQVGTNSITSGPASFHHPFCWPFLKAQRNPVLYPTPDTLSTSAPETTSPKGEDGPGQKAGSFLPPWVTIPEHRQTGGRRERERSNRSESCLSASLRGSALQQELEEAD